AGRGGDAGAALVLEVAGDLGLARLRGGRLADRGGGAGRSRPARRGPLRAPPPPVRGRGARTPPGHPPAPPPGRWGLAAAGLAAHELDLDAEHRQDRGAIARGRGARTAPARRRRRRPAVGHEERELVAAAAPVTVCPLAQAGGAPARAVRTYSS